MPAAFEDWYAANDDYHDYDPVRYESGVTFTVGHQTFSDDEEALKCAIRTGLPVYCGATLYFDPKKDKI